MSRVAFSRQTAQMTALVIAALLTAPPPQAAPPVVEDPGARWQPLEWVQLIVNDRPILRGEIEIEMLRRSQRQPVTTDEDSAALAEAVQIEFIRRILDVQSGQDMGFDKRIINREVDVFLGRRSDELGLLAEAQLFADSGVDRNSARNEVADSYYRLHHLRATTGEDVGAGGRPTQDRFVRPGSLYGAYLINRDQLGEPARVTLQELAIGKDIVGGRPEDALEFCQQCLEDILSGKAELGELAANYGPSAASRERKGMTEPIPVFGRGDEPAILQWARTAEIGSYSPITPILRKDGSGEILGYEIVKLVAREEGAPAPPFEDETVQETLEEGLLEYFDAERLDRSFREQERASFLQSFRFPELRITEDPAEEPGS